MIALAAQAPAPIEYVTSLLFALLVVVGVLAAAGVGLAANVIAALCIAFVISAMIVAIHFARIMVRRRRAALPDPYAQPFGDIPRTPYQPSEWERRP